MLKLNITKEDYAKLPEALQAEYNESGAGYTIQVEGMKTQGDVDAVLKAKDQAKREQREAQDALKAIQRERDELNDKVNAYETNKDLKLSQEEKVELQRLKRENEQLAKEKGEVSQKYSQLESELTTGKIKGKLVEAASKHIGSEFIPDFVELAMNKFTFSDGKVLTNEKQGDKSGLEAEAYFSELVKTRPHLAPQSSGGGAGGGKGSGGGSQNEPRPTGCNASKEAWGELK